MDPISQLLVEQARLTGASAPLDAPAVQEEESPREKEKRLAREARALAMTMGACAPLLAQMRALGDQE